MFPFALLLYVGCVVVWGFFFFFFLFFWGGGRAAFCFFVVMGIVVFTVVSLYWVGWCMYVLLLGWVGFVVVVLLSLRFSCLFVVVFLDCFDSCINSLII